jgi:hypothetical protein
MPSPFISAKSTFRDREEKMAYSKVMSVLMSAGKYDRCHDQVARTKVTWLFTAKVLLHWNL